MPLTMKIKILNVVLCGGTAWAMNHVYAYAQKFTVIERYPCNHCGECPVWLAAYDKKGDNLNDN